ncbi:PLP-dependent aminotransferase family protein [Gordonia soli]|uniref:Putative GntR family transcriptional regulator n=1 Tax=Gordonia soli NBRC 108243 TaxID=1223545 RepID=M0QHC0_9ACTN|nr:PLP-dependent aminotransferase family protein [Gordonia soli]GAC67933.1 putative GntR family transcriptional regulator [Gordonia soli NBRC 108243]
MSDDSSGRIAAHLRALAEQRPAGTRLPSTRAIAAEFGAGPVTVQRALAVLVAEGVVETRSGQGTFVRARRNRADRADVAWQTTALGADRSGPTPTGSILRQVPHDTIAMHSGYPDPSLMPVAEVRAAVTRAARRDDVHLRPAAAGLPDLRRWFVDELGADGWHDTDAVIAAGGQAALSATFRALAAPGQSVVMESPTYWGAIAAARQAGLTVVPVGRRAGAPDPDDLDAALAASGARMLYVQPTHANPTGDVWTPAQREAVLEVAVAHRAFVVEDDWAHDFALEATPPPMAASDRDGHVVYIRSLTKSMSVAVRVAAVLARGPARARIDAALSLSDLYVSPLLQVAALDIVTRPAWRTHLLRLRRELRIRRDRLLDEVATVPELTVGRPPTGGLNLWVRLPDLIDGSPTDPDAVAARCLAAGLSLSPGSEWFPAEQTGPFVRLNYAASAPDRYGEAVAILAAALSTGR